MSSQRGEQSDGVQAPFGALAAGTCRVVGSVGLTTRARHSSAPSSANTTGFFAATYSSVAKGEDARERPQSVGAGVVPKSGFAVVLRRTDECWPAGEGVGLVFWLRCRSRPRTTEEISHRRHTEVQCARPYSLSFSAPTPPPPPPNAHSYRPPSESSPAAPRVPRHNSSCTRLMRYERSLKQELGPKH